MYKLGFKEAEEPESKLPTLTGSKNIYFCFTDYAKAFECVDHSKLWKILKETGVRDLPPKKLVCRSGSSS